MGAFELEREAKQTSFSGTERLRGPCSFEDTVKYFYCSMDPCSTLYTSAGVWEPCVSAV